LPTYDPVVAITSTFLDDHHLVVGETHFHCDFPLKDVPAGRLPVMKTRDMIGPYVALCERVRPVRIAELGIRRGGSTALLNELARPEKLVAVELQSAPAPALTSYIERHGMAEVVRPHYGVDQADRVRLAGLIDAELGGHLLDLVVDDASHRYEETRSSFETLFPRLRTDGIFVIEDWRGRHLMMDRIAASLQDPTPHGRAAIEEILRRQATGPAPPQPAPLSKLAFELVLARASSEEAVAELSLDGYWIRVRRGPGPLDPSTFRLSDLYEDHFGLIRNA